MCLWEEKRILFVPNRNALLRFHRKSLLSHSLHVPCVARPRRHKTFGFSGQMNLVRSEINIILPHDVWDQPQAWRMRLFPYCNLVIRCCCCSVLIAHHLKAEPCLNLTASPSCLSPFLYHYLVHRLLRAAR